MKQQSDERYKLVVSITLGEIRGQGVKTAAKCWWDGDTDAMATYTFTNVIKLMQDSLFCVATVFAVYYY